MVGRGIIPLPTKTGASGIEIGNVKLITYRKVALTPMPPIYRDIPGINMKLAPGEEPRKLDQGESQIWGTDLDTLKNKLRADQAENVLAIAVDTTGKPYEQKHRLPWWFLKADDTREMRFERVATR